MTLARDQFGKGGDLGAPFPGLMPPLKADAWVGGMDVGATVDPSVLTLGYLDGHQWHVHLRVNLLHMYTPHQVAVVHYLNQRVTGGKLSYVAVDMQGYGRPVGQALLNQPEFGGIYERIALDANFGGVVEVEAEEWDQIAEQMLPVIKKVPSKEWMTMALRDLFYEIKLYHPPDQVMLEEILACTETKTPKGYVTYHVHKKGGSYGRGGAVADHILDSLRCLAKAINHFAYHGPSAGGSSWDDPTCSPGWAEIAVRSGGWRPPWGL